MCHSTAAGLQGQEGEQQREGLRRQLAAVVRSVQWSYAIFWALSAGQQGVLEWNNGYYNGDIKTRKTTQAMEIRADQWGIQRSEQLKELYISLSAGDSNPCARRPSASLSPEDLTDSEWYYLVCMSFTFSPGQGLPGRTLTGGNHIWLCNAHFAESKIFSRSLLAKSAYIQTVACFPLMGGVLELGTTELAFEDLNFVKNITDSFWDFPRSIYSEQSMSDSLNLDENEDQVPPCVQQISNSNPSRKFLSPADAPLISSYISSKDTDLMDDDNDEFHQNASENFKTGSADCSSDDCPPNQQMDSSFANGMSLVHSWQFIDDDQSNGLHASLKSSDCISQSFVDPLKKISSQRVKLTIQPTPELQEGKWNEPSSVDLDDDYVHYRRSISAILKTVSQHVQAPRFLNRSRASSFTAWKQCLDMPNQSIVVSQKLLKRMLLGKSWMHDPGTRGVCKENKLIKKDPALNFGIASPNSLEQRRREKLNEKFLVLRSLVPSLNKVDKESILDDTIDYLKDLERKIQELESLRDSMGHEPKGRKRYPDVSERTSDNYGNNGNSCGKKLCSNTRNVCGTGDTGTDILSVALKDSNADISVTMVEDKVTIEVHCPWRECLLLEIVDIVSSIHLDAHSVRSSTDNGMLSMTIQSKFQGTVMASPAMIKQALYRVLGKR